MRSPTRGAGRDALRRAVRNHPNFPTAFPAGSRAVGDLTMKELYALARRMGMDPGAIYAAAKAGAAAPLSVPEGAVIVADEEPEDTDEDTDEDTAAEPDAMASAIDDEMKAIRDTITQHGFSALDARLRELVTEARKPPVTVYVDRAGDTAAVAGAAPVIVAQPTGATVSWRKAFGIKGKAGERTAQLWDGAHPDTPQIDPVYVWPETATLIALTQIARGRNVYGFGPAGTGKTQWAEQLAARLGRPFALISCDAATDGPTLVGMTVPKGDSVAWQDGQLARAIQIPGCVICIDEPSIARPGALFAMQNILANRVLWISETGRRIPVANGVIFCAMDNTNGMGGGARRGYTDTQRLNLAFLDRFGPRVAFGYLPDDKEAAVIVARTGCTSDLARLLVSAATLTRAAADSEQITNGIGLRRLLAWAELLTDGVDCEEAFKSTILHAAPDQDRETLRQQCSLAVDSATVAAALGASNATTTADPSITNPTAAGRSAASDFRLHA